MRDVLSKIPKTEIFFALSIIVFLCTGMWNILLLLLVWCLIKNPAIPEPRQLPGPVINSALHSHDNNFNLLRIIFAWGVILEHSYDLSNTPLDGWFAQNIARDAGGYSVNLFFFISGFLVSQSLIRRRNIRNFIIARALRLLPALAVVILISVFMLGPYFTNLPLSDYFKAQDTWDYLYRNILLIRTEYSLPGVFLNNPYTPHVNGALWSLRYEIKMYALLAVMSVIGIFVRPKLFAAFFIFYFSWYLLIVFKCVDWDIGYSFLRTSLYFYLGCLAFRFNERFTIKLWHLILLALLVVLCLQTPLYRLTEALALCSATLYIAAFPGKILRRYNKLGDYSYGTYLIGGPVLQSLLSLQPGIDHKTLLLSASVIAIGLAIVSWHLVEKPCLALIRKKN